MYPALYSAVQYSTVQYCITKYGTVQYNLESTTPSTGGLGPQWEV